jgi:hypothetical protein
MVPGIGSPSSGLSRPLQNPVLASIIYILLILLVFIPLAVNRYKKAASR